MYAPDETPGRRKNWGVIYIILTLMGLFALIPSFAPVKLGIGWPWILAWGLPMLVGFGASALAAFNDNKWVWLENTAAWLGNAGLSVYVLTLVQSVAMAGTASLPGTLGYIALLVIMVSRAYRLQRYLKKQRRLKEIVRIAHRNDKAG